MAQLTDLPFADGSFDYVVSLDVFGHIAFDEKDAVLAEIKRVLRPDGVTMHGIETLNRELHGDYASMSEEKLAHFIGIDGHIGLEVDDEIAARFGRFFTSVQCEPRYTLCLSVAEFIKQYDEYGVPFDADFIDYLRGLSFTERNAFDMAMGYVFGKISDLGLKLPSSGLYLLVKASNAAPEPFYNAHRDRSDLFFNCIFRHWLVSGKPHAAHRALDERSLASAIQRHKRIEDSPRTDDAHSRSEIRTRRASLYVEWRRDLWSFFN